MKLREIKRENWRFFFENVLLLEYTDFKGAKKENEAGSGDEEETVTIERTKTKTLKGKIILFPKR